LLPYPQVRETVASRGQRIEGGQRSPVDQHRVAVRWIGKHVGEPAQNGRFDRGAAGVAYAVYLYLTRLSGRRSPDHVVAPVCISTASAAVAAGLISPEIIPPAQPT
jgi:hypothetical protein